MHLCIRVRQFWIMNSGFSSWLIADWVEQGHNRAFAGLASGSTNQCLIVGSAEQQLGHNVGWEFCEPKVPTKRDMHRQKREEFIFKAL